MGHLDGQAAVVTGTAQGIGGGIADLLESEGAIVHRVDKDAVDLRESSAVDAFFAALGEVRILVNNAGGVQGQTHTPIDELTDADWDGVLIARGVLFFVAPDAGWVSGQTISIDGGHSLF
jgi:3-oxoacyl-[acyl-carrier protein] reductase